MIKVLRIITRLNIGGPGIHTILLSSALNEKGFYKDILICGKVSESEGDMAYFAKDKGLEPVVIPDLGRDISFKKDIKAFFNLYSIIKKERPDIIHTHTAKAGALGRLAAIFAGVPVKIHTFHGHVFDGYFNPFRARLFILIERFLALFTDKVITVSNIVEDDIVNKLRIAKVAKSAVIPLGFELEKFLHCESQKGVFRKKMGLSDDASLIGIIGRLVPIKNHRMFLDVARIILDKNRKNNIKFLIIGDGELKDFLEGYAKKLNLQNHVIFTGWVEDLASVYADLDIAALTSLNEGTPVSLIEAMASAKPVVATAVGGVRDLITEDKNGLLANSNDAEDFSKKLLILLDNNDIRLRFGICGREFVKEKYSKNRLINDIKNLYEECLKEKAHYR